MFGQLKLTFKQQKVYLLTKVDKAIEDAPEIIEKRTCPDIKGLQEKESNLRGLIEGIVSQYQFNRTATTSEQFEIDRLDKEIEDVRIKIWNKEIDHIANCPDYLTIKVPGDGMFRILNEKQALQKFKKVVSKYLVSTSKKKGPSEKALSKSSAPRQESIGNLYPLKQQGWFTDGDIAVKGTPPKNAKMITEEKEKADLEAVIPKSTVPAKLLYYGFVDPDVGYGVSLEPIAEITGEAYPPLVIFESEDKRMGYNQRKFNVIRNRFPNAKYKARKNDTESGPLLAYDKGELVGLIMPIRLDNEIAILDEKGKSLLLIQTRALAEAQKGRW